MGEKTPWVSVEVRFNMKPCDRWGRTDERFKKPLNQVNDLRETTVIQSVQLLDTKRKDKR